MKTTESISQLRGIGLAHIKRGLAMFMCLVMLSGVVPASAMAAQEDGQPTFGAEDAGAGASSTPNDEGTVVSMPASKEEDAGQGMALHKTKRRPL